MWLLWEQGKISFWGIHLFYLIISLSKLKHLWERLPECMCHDWKVPRLEEYDKMLGMWNRGAQSLPSKWLEDPQGASRSVWMLDGSHCHEFSSRVLRKGTGLALVIYIQDAQPNANQAVLEVGIINGQGEREGERRHQWKVPWTLNCIHTAFSLRQDCIHCFNSFIYHKSHMRWVQFCDSWLSSCCRWGS